MRISPSVFEERESIEGGGVAGGGELLFAGLVLSSQSECDAWSIHGDGE